MNRGTVYTCGNVPLQKNLGRLLDASGLGRLLDASGLGEQVQEIKTILIKPNLVNVLPPPITTPVELIAHLIDYLKAITAAEIIIGEGTAYFFFFFFFAAFSSVSCRHFFLIRTGHLLQCFPFFRYLPQQLFFTFFFFFLPITALR